MAEEYLSVGAHDPIAVAHAGASGKGVCSEVRNRRPSTLKLRHESAWRDSQDVAGEKQREVEEVGGGSYTNADANERRPRGTDRFRTERSGTLARHAPSDRGHDPAGVSPMMTPRLLVPSEALRSGPTPTLTDGSEILPHAFADTQLGRRQDAAPAGLPDFPSKHELIAMSRRSYFA